jgi:hypothetical protein
VIGGLPVHGHQYFYERADYHPLSSEYLDILYATVPSSWEIKRDDVWVQVSAPSNGPPPSQGFKIHVTITPNHAKNVLELFVPRCISRDIDFKIIGDTALHLELNSKRFPRAASGKFMTIYPKDLQTFETFIEDLYQCSREKLLAGPRILSDRIYKDSKILSYRYGGFFPRRQVNIDGTHATMLRTPNEGWIVDERVPYFMLPDWIKDPFGGTRTIRQPLTVRLRGRYDIDRALSFSNAGGIYRGVDIETGQEVAVKEARPLTNFWISGNASWDAVDLLKREYSILQRLAGDCPVPRPVDYFEDCGHSFLVEDYIHGVDLRKFWAKDDVILAPFIRTRGRILTWTRAFTYVADSLLKIVGKIHDQGVVIGDLSPENVLIDLDTRRLSILDFESAVTDDDDDDWRIFSAMWGTPGFIDVARSSGRLISCEDDWYSVAMILYASLAPAQLLLLNPRARENSLANFELLGVPTDVASLINCLLCADLRGARGALDSLSNYSGD